MNWKKSAWKYRILDIVSIIPFQDTVVSFLMQFLIASRKWRRKQSYSLKSQSSLQYSELTLHHTLKKSCKDRHNCPVRQVWQLSSYSGFGQRATKGNQGLATTQRHQNFSVEDAAEE